MTQPDRLAYLTRVQFAAGVAAVPPSDSDHGVAVSAFAAVSSHTSPATMRPERIRVSGLGL